jgi:hypothetical protein
MFREARSAAESTAIANMILHDAKAYAIFVNDKSDAQSARAEARKLFVPKNLFGKVNPYLSKLQDHYNFASQRAHTNRMSSMRHIMMQPMADETVFSLIEIIPQNANVEVKAYVYWTCLVHMDILDTVATFVFPEIDAKQSEFQEQQKAIAALMDELRAHVQRLEWRRRNESRRRMKLDHQSPTI